jgi:hypothetical protein
MQAYLLYFHSILRYFILLFAVIVVIQSLTGMMGKKKFQKSNKQGALVLLIFCDLQLLLGLALYFLKGWATVLTTGGAMANAYNRFWTVEHSVGMLVAIILVHIGYSSTKKNMDDDRKFKRLFWCSFVALVIFVATIPWAQKQVVGRPNIPVLSS